MVKVRMNTADVAAEVKCLRRLIGMRCSNVYDLSPKTYVFKLMNSSGVTESGESEKVLLLMESGVRLHTTAYVRDKSNTPSGFTLKLRKHIRTRRLEDVRQLGYDRIILFQFGLGANAHYVILELYAQGNILLTDSEFMVLTLLRSHRDDDKGFAIMSRHRYPIEICRVFERTTIAKLQEALASLKEVDSNDNARSDEGGTNDTDVPKGKQGNRKNGKLSESNKTPNDGARAKQAMLKSFLGEALGYGPQLSEHIILDAGLVPNTKIGKDFKLDEATCQVLAQAVAKFEDWLEDIISGDRIPEGYILMLQKNSDQIYDEFCPLLLNQFKSRDSVKFETFDASLDEFYSKIESQRVEQQQKTKEGSAMQKLSKIRMDQENRVHTLKKEVDRCVTMAELIEYNLDDVDSAILAVRVALANGMNWEDLARMVKEERKSGNPVASLIDKLYLERNCMTLLLSNNLDEMDDDEKTQPVEKVEVDLALSAHANARRWYEQKKKQESKQEKTITAHDKAFKAAERKTRLQLSQEKTVAAISHMRKVHWFEKFNWFISSENYLVISGRDAQQNEMIVKRYMSKGDLYVHAELHGASSTVIKNHKPEHPVPPLTLNQTGCFTVCHSQAWDSKIVTSAWWVYPHQVSKTAPTGEYLTVGSFMIRGKKNFLPPQPLIMGFGILFRLDDSSLGSHLNERRVRGEEEGINDVEETGPFKEISDSDSEKEVADEKHMLESESITDSLTDHSKPVSGGLSSEVSSGNALSSPDIKAINSDEVLVEDMSTFNGFDKKNVTEIVGESVASVSPQLEDLIDRALEIGAATASGKDYGLHAPQVRSAEERNNEEKRPPVREKPYVSKAERRKLKKGQKNSTMGANVEHEKEEVEDNSSTASQPDKNVQNLKPGGGGKVSRGQRSKLKKMKEKYADQDEEERKIRMALLASAGKVEKNDKDSQDEKATTGKANTPAVGAEDAQKICYKCKKPGHLSRDCQERPDEAVHGHSNGGLEDNPHAGLSNTANEMDKIAMEEDDIHEIGEDEREKLNDVDYLTGNPLPNDILLYAVPVCGPYSALQSYKYRVKIVPGTAKKGKAAKMAMNLFSHIPEVTNREKELMKACTDPELVAAIVGNVKITAAGLTQLKQKQKKGKKTNKEGS
ncbi:nuclear export mediator factor Nemf isoform X1 [Camellia sinensis]|uniref:nuclear export mediator factor Nemf isoform X1 n=1 Tax=Camellia sinensis TaxID=4442 RepID=UPI0010366ADD|nr:nuclear export mediator factor Nemf isoform X1 [Camellia sinensis]